METLLALALIVFAAALRPWRLLAHRGLQSPFVALLLVLPVVWTLPLRQDISLNLQWSGACLVAICLGWPLATLTAGRDGRAHLGAFPSVACCAATRLPMLLSM